MRILCSCGKYLRVNDELLGKRVKCPACGERVVVEETPPEPARRRAAPPEDEDEPEPARRRSAGAVEDEDKPRRRKKRRRKAKSAGPMRWVVLGGGGALLVAVVVGIAILTANRGEPPGTSAPSGDRQANKGQPAADDQPPAKGLSGQKNVTRLAYSRDGKRLATAVFNHAAKGGDPALQIWDLAQDKMAASFPGHKLPVSHLAFSPDGSLLASSCGFEYEIKLWDCGTGTIRHQFREESAGPRLGERLLAFSPDGKSLLSVMIGEVVQMDVATGKVKKQTVFMNLFTQAAASPSAPVVAIAQILPDQPPRAAVTLFKYTTREEQEMPLPNTPTAIAFSRDGGTLAVATRDGGVVVFDARSRKVRATLPKPKTSPDGNVSKPGAQDLFYYERLALNHDGTRLCGIPLVSNAEVWDVATRQNRTLTAGRCADAAFSPDGRTLAVAVENGGAVRFIDPSTGQERTP